MEFDRQTSAGYLVNAMARLFAQTLEARIRPLGLRIGYFPALLHLAEQEGLTQKDLVALLGVEQPTLANTLARMERDGLVRREKDQGDGRSQRIWLTDLARSLMGPAKAAAAEVNAAALAPLTPDERVAFVAMMRRIIPALSEEAP